MKILLIISFLFSLLLSNDTRLVIGSFKEEKNAKYEKIKIDKIIQKDAKFKSFLKKNSVSTKHKMIGEWHVVSFEPFSDSKTKMATYFKIKKLYPDTYSLDIHATDEKEVLAPKSDKKMVLPEATIKQSTPIETPKAEVEKVAETVVAETETQEQMEASKMDEADENVVTNANTVEEESNPVTSYLFGIILVVLLLVALIVYMIQKKPKKTDLSEIED